MNRRRLCEILLPTCLGAFLVVVTLLGVFSGIETLYRQRANREFANLVGAVIEAAPETDRAEIIRWIRTENDARTERGLEILRQYGLMDDDYASTSAEFLTRETKVLIVGGVAIFAVTVVIYFWLLDYRRERKINSLVAYLQALSERVYDLRLAENSEDELSLLTNELYKITVMLKEAAEQNRTHRQNLEVALADISHQLRTPLTSLQVVLDNVYDDPKMLVAVRQEFLHAASRQVVAMSELVTTLLNLAKFDNGSIKLHDQEVEVGEIFTAIKQNLEVLSDLRDVKLEVAGDLEAKIKLDLRWQTEALTNIAKNCIEHSYSGGKVILSAESTPLFTKITVRDFGEGIAPEDLRHVFERFYKARNASQESVGIGLAFAKAIIMADGGQVSVKSELGQGTKFTVTYFAK